jgi:SAM-dependent methyltransferase
MLRTFYLLAFICSTLVPASDAHSQQTSVNPGINDSFRDPDVQEFTGRFEVESREVFVHRRQIVEACQIKPGQTVADIGAGTGLFTRLFSDSVGRNGRVIAVDISQKFLDHIATTSQKAGQPNVDTLLATEDATGLPPNSVDVAFICDTYHHFEFPLKTMASIRRALKPDGRVIVIDFHRIPGKSSDWIMNHVRAGQEVFEAEIIQSGFTKIHEEPKLLDENYFVVFQKNAEDASKAAILRSRVRFSSADASGRADR